MWFDIMLLAKPEEELKPDEKLWVEIFLKEIKVDFVREVGD